MVVALHILPSYFTFLVMERLILWINGLVSLSNYYLVKIVELVFISLTVVQLHGITVAMFTRHFVRELRGISAHLGYELSPQKTEEFLFSNGGVNPGQWRQYVVNHWH
jgi:hypothetical protein